MKNRTAQAYVVRFEGRYFYRGRDRRGSAIGTLVPSFAEPMTYSTGAAVARLLREQGHVDAHVADLHGQPVLPEDSYAADVCESDEFKHVWADACR